ncbi:MAG: hypothetical protein IJV94_03015 [Bacilli bacterium]|nr:hypothetical protein [Bacilli bacterium]
MAQSMLGILEPNTTYTVSVWALAENIVRGTTNPACMLYLDGSYPKDGTAT